MLKSRLFIRAHAAGTKRGVESKLFTTVILSRPYFPARGVPYSLLVHAVVLSILIFLRVSHSPLDQPPPAPRAIVIDDKEQRVVMYLPLLGGGREGMGSEGRGFPGGGLEARRKGPPAASAPGKKGLSYPGPQRILSDFPKPTNRSQTLLQTALQNPPVLPPPLSLPNIVKMTDAGPETKPKPKVPAVKAPPVIKPAQPPEPPSLATLAMPAPVDELKMIQPASIPKIGPLPEIKYPEPIPSIKPPEEVKANPAPEDANDVAPPEPPPMPPEPIRIDAPAKVLEEPAESPRRELSPVPTRGNDMHNLLALSPMPAVPPPLFEVPVGEARGRFAISPEANLATNEMEPGPQLETSASAVGIGIHTGAAAGNGSGAGGGGTDAGSGAGTGTGSGGGTGSGTGSGPGAGPGPGVGSGSGPGSGSGSGSIAGSGSGTAPGTGSGKGSGTGTGTGTGAGSGPGRGPFAGISIIGGVGDTGAAAAGKPAPRTPPKRPLQSAYGITIISTENSGGGLPPFGVFAREQVYTVYLDMRQDAMDSTPSWTLEFAVPQGAPGQVDPAGGTNQQGLVLPFPVTKTPPVLPAELVRKYLRRMMIVYAVVNVEGKLEQISVKESPDVLLNEPVVSALSKWTFRPARMNGDPVPAKVLMGIPLWLPE